MLTRNIIHVNFDGKLELMLQNYEHARKVRLTCQLQILLEMIYMQTNLEQIEHMAEPEVRVLPSGILTPQLIPGTEPQRSW